MIIISCMYMYMYLLQNYVFFFVKDVSCQSPLISETAKLKKSLNLDHTRGNKHYTVVVKTSFEKKLSRLCHNNSTYMYKY